MFDMRRREFITLLGGATAAWPLAARAQQPGKVWRMGFIAHGHESFHDAFFEGLREYGYEEGRNLLVERRYARGRAERFKEFAAESFLPEDAVAAALGIEAWSLGIQLILATSNG
jgi:putative tryptophan/tyrosine transport system substrate-binding protein